MVNAYIPHLNTRMRRLGSGPRECSISLKGHMISPVMKYFTLYSRRAEKRIKDTQGFSGDVQEVFRRRVIVTGKDKGKTPDRNGEHIPNKGKGFSKATSVIKRGGVQE